MNVIDVGAHVGYYTLLFSKCVGLLGRIVSFEPLPANFTSLQKNVQLNNLRNVQSFPQAVFSEIQEVTISLPDPSTDSGQASICRAQGAEQVRVQATTLDSFCSSFDFRPDFLKIDVEGAEYDVLLGGQEVVAKFRPVMLIELHHFDGNLAAHPVPELLAWWDYEIEWIDRWDLTSHILARPRSGAPLSIQSDL